MLKAVITSHDKMCHVNFFGIVIGSRPIPLDKYGFKGIDEDKDIKFFQKESIKMNKYVQLYPVKNKEIIR